MKESELIVKICVVSGIILIIVGILLDIIKVYPN